MLCVWLLLYVVRGAGDCWLLTPTRFRTSLSVRFLQEGITRMKRILEGKQTEVRLFPVSGRSQTGAVRACVY